MDTLWEIVLQIGALVLILCLIFFVGGFCVYKYNVEIAEANIVSCFKDDTKVYEGKKALIKIDSGGMTTTLTIYKKLFPFPITDKVYSSSNIEVR
jgi:hypothetical protein